ncbi:hypothetical protein EYF80_007958 [Liparis tanakae]|uniref:Uncharacterized protein n=1 Tax=Liparis tanakae TaxID=230148 RepID=A0A4Z2IV02_9TELE|nr:hypothetical protein EYF80_007958 [Liparis tanakae]
MSRSPMAGTSYSGSSYTGLPGDTGDSGASDPGLLGGGAGGGIFGRQRVLVLRFRLLISMMFPMISTGPVTVFLRGERSSFIFFRGLILIVPQSRAASADAGRHINTAERAAAAAAARTQK